MKINKFLIFALVYAFCFSACNKHESKITGEIFVAANSGQSAKLGAVNVYLFRKVRADGYEKGGVSPLDFTDKADYKTVSDSYGKFSFTVPPNDYTIAVNADRTVLGKTEDLSWLLNLSNKNGETVISLNNQNMR